MEKGKEVQVKKSHHEASRWAALVAYYLLGENTSAVVRLTGHTAVTVRAWVKELSPDEVDILKKIALQHKSDVTSEMVTQIRRMMVSGILGTQLLLINRLHSQVHKMSPNQASNALRVLNEVYKDERDNALGLKGAVSNAKTSIADELLKQAGLSEAMKAKQERDYSDAIKDLFPQDIMEDYNEEE